MARLYGREWSREELLTRVGDLSQVAGVRMVEWADGNARGLRAADLRTGSGLTYTVLLDRGMDIGPAAYGAIPLAFISPVGFPHPAYFEPEGIGWLRTFGGGLLVGCGLTNVGEPCEDDGESLGQHGRLSLLPAGRVATGEEWDGDVCRFWVRGEMRQARFFGENLRLTRTISSWLGESRIAIHDTVENLGAAPSPLMFLYHINPGFPLMDEGCRLEAAPHPVQPRDADAGPGAVEWMHTAPPTAGYREQVFYHDLPADSEGFSEIALINPRLGLRLSVRFLKETLPNLVQWKQMGQGAYVIGLEPANCLVDGRAAERARGTLQFLQPGERRDFKVEIAIKEETES